MSMENLAEMITTFNHTDEAFKPRLFQRLRQELIQELPTLPVNEERKSYLLHQMAYVHSFEELTSLLKEMNLPSLSVE